MTTAQVQYTELLNNDDELTDNNDGYTFDEALDRIGFGWYQLLMMQLCGAGWMFDGIGNVITVTAMDPLLINPNSQSSPSYRSLSRS